MIAFKLTTVVFLLAFFQAGNPPSLVVWIAPSLQRTGQFDAPANPTRALLYAARGEYESFQIVVQAGAAGLTNVTLSVSDFQGPAGQTIANSNVALFREQFVQVNPSSPDFNGSNRPLPAGWFADPLIPFIDPSTGAPPQGGVLHAAPANVPANQNQPYWVDVFVPRTAPAGQYTATYAVSSDQGSFKGDIALTVWNFTLPLRPSFKTSVLLWKATDRLTQQELLRNKVSAAVSNNADATSLLDDGLGTTNLGFWSGADGSNCAMQPPPSAQRLQQAVSQLHPDLFVYNYTADEISRCTALYPLVKQWGLNLHQAGVRNLITIVPTPDLFDDGSNSGRSAVDIWVVLPRQYDRGAAGVRQVLQKGDEVWSYNALTQDSYSPKWLIDYDPINFRIQPGFISESLGLTGLLYWRADLWSNDPWNQVNNIGLFSAGNNYPGEGMLIYPGYQVGLQGVAPSMRLKWIRDGIEDFEYVEYAKRLGQGDAALQLARGVGPDWTNWTRSADAVYNARFQIGRQLDKISGESVTLTTNFDLKASPPSASGSSQTFTFTYNVPSGAGDVSSATVLFNDRLDVRNACWISYDPASGALALARDDVSAWDQMALDSGATLENSQCLLDSRGASASAAANGTLSLTVPVTFKPAFAGQKNIYLRVQLGPNISSDYFNAGGFAVSGQ